MKERLQSVWEEVHSSFWFVPLLMALAAFLLSIATVSFDRTSASVKFANSLGFVWSGGAEGARSLLSTIASSMITVAGVVFSITIVALTLASSQFGPRLLRNFVSDNGNQFTLGTFISTFLYCILILRTIRGQDEGGFVPLISVTCGLALALASLGVLIYFIHHVSGSIQAEKLIARVGGELDAAIREHFREGPAPPGLQNAEREFSKSLEALLPTSILATQSGYLQRIDRDGLLSYAVRADAKIVLKQSPGDFVMENEVLAIVWAGVGASTATEEPGTLNEFFVLGPQRAESQDVGFGVRQLSEIAARALSPGINDPYTAMACLDWMTDAFSLGGSPPTDCCFAQRKRRHAATHGNTCLL